jgi:hypothetical protein
MLLFASSEEMVVHESLLCDFCSNFHLLHQEMVDCSALSFLLQAMVYPLDWKPRLNKSSAYKKGN